MKATVIKQTGGKSVVAVTAIKDIALVLCTSIENVDYEEMRGAQGEYTAFYQAESLGEYENEQAMEMMPSLTAQLGGAILGDVVIMDTQDFRRLSHD